jgi:hypothetical protein
MVLRLLEQVGGITVREILLALAQRISASHAKYAAKARQRWERERETDETSAGAEGHDRHRADTDAAVAVRRAPLARIRNPRYPLNLSLSLSFPLLQLG